MTLLPDPEPRECWATIVSVDDHVVEPPDIFQGRFPLRFVEQAPRVVDTENGGQAWFWVGQVLPNVGFNAVAGRAAEEYSAEPTRFEHMRRGAWDIQERVRDMDINGIWASVCFPSFLPGFVGQRLSLWPEDPELALAAVRAYNDWHLEAWCGSYPTRMIPIQLPYLRDPVVAAEEIRRNAARGFKAVTFSEAPHRFGLRSIHSGEWDPFLSACAETETVVNLHAGSSGEMRFNSSDDAPALLTGALFGPSAFASAMEWLYSGIPMRFPDLRICMSEGGIGWVAAAVDRLDHVARRADSPGDRVRGPDRPTPDVLRRNFWFCALDEPSGFLTREVIGVENIVVESDYPHADSTWPDTQPLLRRHLAPLDLEEQRLVCWKNAVQLYRHSEPTDPLP